VRESQVRPEQVRLQPHRLLEQLGGLLESLLLDADRPQDRAGRGAGFRCGEGQLRLPISLLEAPFLDEGGRPLQGVVGRGREDRCRQQGARERGDP
jgi:hypothetical protein